MESVAIVSFWGLVEQNRDATPNDLLDAPAQAAGDEQGHAHGAQNQRRGFGSAGDVEFILFAGFHAGTKHSTMDAKRVVAGDRHVIRAGGVNLVLDERIVHARAAPSAPSDGRLVVGGQ